MKELEELEVIESISMVRVSMEMVWNKVILIMISIVLLYSYGEMAVY